MVIFLIILTQNVQHSYCFLLSKDLEKTVKISTKRAQKATQCLTIYNVFIRYAISHTLQSCMARRSGGKEREVKAEVRF